MRDRVGGHFPDGRRCTCSSARRRYSSQSPALKARITTVAPSHSSTCTLSYLKLRKGSRILSLSSPSDALRRGITHLHWVNTLKVPLSAKPVVDFFTALARVAVSISSDWPPWNCGCLMVTEIGELKIGIGRLGDASGRHADLRALKFYGL